MTAQGAPESHPLTNEELRALVAGWSNSSQWNRMATELLAIRSLHDELRAGYETQCGYIEKLRARNANLETVIGKVRAFLAAPEAPESRSHNGTDGGTGK